MFYNLQILRAVAALSVVLYHIRGTALSYNYNPKIVSLLGNLGASGVDIFFVISGFIMLHTQFNNKQTILNFFKKRVIRIAPLYWLVTTIVILIYVLFPSIFREHTITVGWALASYAFNSNALGLGNPILHVGWTLQWEILFYLIFGLGLWFRNWSTALIFNGLMLTVLATYTANYILLEFVGGLLAALLHNKFYSKPHYGWCALSLGSFLLLISISSTVSQAIEHRVLLWGLPSLLIVFGAVTVKQFRTTVGNLLGDASYSIYLLQVLSIPAFYKFMSWIGINFNNDLLALLCLIFTAVGGLLMYLFLEKPLILFLGSKVSTRKSLNNPNIK